MLDTGNNRWYNKGVDKKRGGSYAHYTQKERGSKMQRLFGDEIIIKAHTRAKAYNQERSTYRFVVHDYELEDKWRVTRDVLELIPSDEELLSIEVADDETTMYGEYVYSSDEEFEDCMENIGATADGDDMFEDFYESFYGDMDAFLDEFGEGDLY